MNCPALTATVPVAVHCPLEVTQLSDDAAIDPGTPTRSVTVMLLDCREYTLKLLTVHAAGTHDNTLSASVEDAFGEFTA